MENLLTQENLEDIRELIEDKIANVPTELILFGAIGTLLLSTYLNKTGHKEAASVVGKLSIPIIGVGLAKYKDLLKSEIDNQLETVEEVI